MALATTEIDLELMESLIADPALPMQEIGSTLGVSESTLYARRKSDSEHNRHFERGMVRREAACVASNGSDPDEIVMRAICLGFETRSQLKRALGLGYDVIEKAIERNLGDLEVESHGSIEILRPKEITVSQAKYICVDCGGPRSYGSGQRCKKCYDARAAANTLAKQRTREELGPEEEAALELMRGGKVSEREARISAEIDQELVNDEGEDDDEGVESTPTPKPCGCGRPHNHGGRCAYRRANSPSLADEIATNRRAKANGRPRIEVDLQKFEDLLANPDLTIAEVGEAVGVNRNLIYSRKDTDPEFGAAYERGLVRREQAAKKSGKNITETITKPETFQETETAEPERAQLVAQDKTGDTIADFSPSDEEPKHAMAKTEEIIPRNIPATVDGQGIVLYDSIDDCVTEVVNWPKERMVEFFEAFARAMGLPQRPERTEIKLAWSRSFEESDPEGTTGLTYLYLVSLLHHRMEPREKEAVWTLVQYLKRIECAVEEAKGK